MVKNKSYKIPYTALTKPINAKVINNNLQQSAFQMSRANLSKGIEPYTALVHQCIGIFILVPESSIRLGLATNFFCT